MQAWEELLIGATKRFFPKSAVRHCLTVPEQLEGSGALDRGDMNRPSTEPQAEEHRALQDQRKQAVKQARKDKAAQEVLAS